MSTEFNTNMGINKPQQTVQPKTVEKEQVAAQQIEKVDEPVKSEKVPVGQEAIAGKSQIKTDNVANDLATFCANPKQIQVADAFFDKAYAKLLEQNQNLFLKILSFIVIGSIILSTNSNASSIDHPLYNLRITAILSKL